MAENVKSIDAIYWAVRFHEFRRRLFSCLIEPIVLRLFGPVEEEAACGLEHLIGSDTLYSSVDENHRRLGFLPAYVEKPTYGETSMSFASFFMLFFVLGMLMLVFLSCFYHNQKTSPLFISPRRHRLPKLVPPPLPVDSFFSWIKVIFFMADEEVRNQHEPIQNYVLI